MIIVDDIRQTDVVAVAPDATVGALVHRTLVMDRDCLVGIVTTIDVLKAVAEMN